MKVIRFFREVSPIKLILAGIGIAIISYFVQKPLPNIFLGLRLIAFVVFVYGIIRLTDKNKKWFSRYKSIFYQRI